MNDELHIVGDDALEARVVAVVLGEASEFEREEVDRLCEEKPELAIFRRRVEAVHGLIEDAREPAPAGWTLSPGRRDAVLAKAGVVATLPAHSRKPFWKRREVLSTLAACLLIGVILLGIATPSAMKSLGPDRGHAWMGGSEETEARFGETNAEYGMPADLAKPASPSSSAAREIAANTPAPSAMPVLDDVAEREERGERGLAQLGERHAGTDFKILPGDTIEVDQVRAWESKEPDPAVDPFAAEEPVVAFDVREQLAETESELSRDSIDSRRTETLSTLSESEEVALGTAVETVERGRETSTWHFNEKNGDGLLGGVTRGGLTADLAEELPDLERNLELPAEQPGSMPETAAGGGGGALSPEGLATAGAAIVEEQSLGYFYSDSATTFAGLARSAQDFGRLGETRIDELADSTLGSKADSGLDLYYSRYTAHEFEPMDSPSDESLVNRFSRDGWGETLVEEVPQLLSQERVREDSIVPGPEEGETTAPVASGKAEPGEAVAGKGGRKVAEDLDDAVSNARSDLAAVSLELHEFQNAKREYEASLQMLQQLKLKHSSDKVLMKTPKNPVTVREQASAPKKTGFLGLGDYESQILLPKGGPDRSSEIAESMRAFWIPVDEQVKSSATLGRVVDELDLSKQWGIDKEMAIARLKDQVAVEIPKGTDSIQIRVKDSEGKMARQLTEAVAGAYRENKKLEEINSAKNNLEALAGEIKTQEQEVEQKRKVLDTIVKITGRPYVEESRYSPDDQERRTSTLKTQRRFDLEEQKAQYEIYLQNLDRFGEKQLLSYAAEIPIADNTVQELHGRYIEALQQLAASKSGGLGNDHPEVLKQNEKIASLKLELGTAVGSMKETMRNTYQMVSEELEKLEGVTGARTAGKDGEPNRVRSDTTDANALTLEKLRNIRIPVVEFEDTPLENAVEFLSVKAVELDAGSNLGDRGINFLIENGSPASGERNFDLDAGPGADIGDGESLVNLRLRDVPLMTVLETVCNQAGLRYKVEDGILTLLPLGSGGAGGLQVRSYKIPLETFQYFLSEQSRSNSTADGLSLDDESELPLDAQELFEQAGVHFPEGASARYLQESETLVVRNTVIGIDLVDQFVENLSDQLANEKRNAALDEKDAAAEDSSTFSLNVSDVSFKLAKAALEKGKWPEAVRVEEFVNAMSYGDRLMASGERVGLAMEQAAHPFIAQRNLLRLSLQTAATGRQSGTPLRLTVVLDKSGSMERVDREEAVAEAFRVLVSQLGADDEVTLISFSRTPRLLADGLKGSDGEQLLEIFRDTPSEGGTNVEEALRLAREKAREHFSRDAINRVVLLTDGIANLGNEVPEQLMAMVESMRDEGIALDACGVGAEGVNDEILEALARKGDGRYYLLGSTEESGGDFARQIAGALRPAAKNVKIQVEWNPARVGKWRLYGFEKHELKKEDFRNDAVDAAEMASEEEGVALYHVQVKPDGEGPVGVARARFLDVASGEMIEREWEIPFQGEAAPLENADAKVRLASVAGLFAEKLNRSVIGERVEWGILLENTRALQTLDPKNERIRDLETMIEKAKGLE